MAKTKPIGVRFDEEMLEDLKLSPQKALNYLTEYFYAPKRNVPRETNGIIETLRKKAAIISVDKDYNTEVFENRKAFDNSEIQKQIEAVKNEIKPSWIAKDKFERYQTKKIAELQKQLK